MASFDEFIDSITSDGNDGKAFERFCKHFLETSPEYAGQFEKVWLWNDWPDKWSIDKGIDIIAKYKNSDKFCAIQTKCYAAHQTVPYGEVTNFLADSSRAEIEDRILMMSTNKLSEKTSKEVISGQEKQVIIRDRQYFESINYEYPRHISELSKSKEKEKAKPRPHQVAAINDVEVGLKENDRGQLIMACGTGKTFTTLWVKERLKANTVLVLLPSLNLLSQTMREWVWGANEQFEVLAVCSDPTVVKSKNNEDISTAEVGKVTWHVEEIKSFLKQPSPKVIFCTYQSSELIQEVQKDESIPSFDLVVCDEAHRCAGKAGSSFTTILFEEKIRAQKRLFTTATPKYFSKNIVNAAEGRGVEIVGMDDEVTFGPVVHQLTFGQAINYSPEPLLTDYQVVVVGVTEPMVREWIREAEILSTETGSVDAKTLATKIAVLKAIKDYNLTRVISFHSRIKSAGKFSEEIYQILEVIEPANRPVGTIWSDYVDGKMSAGKRRDLINNLKDLAGFDIGILSNARCLSEGVDVPALDGIAFVDPKESLVDIIQAVGRAIRKNENKTVGTIVLPVFLEEFDDPDQIIDASNFKPIWDVLKALRAHDEVFAENLDQYRTKLGSGRTGSSSKSKKIIFDLPRDLPLDFAESLYTRLVEASTQSWNFWYGLLLKFFEENQHSTVPIDYETSNGFRLGTWVGNQRTKKSFLTKEQLQKLEKVNFVFNVLEHEWEKNYLSLKEFFEKWGNTLVPQDYVTPDGTRLGSWVADRRQRKHILSKEQVTKLDALDFVWNANDHHWNLALELAAEYKRKHGDLLIPTDLEVPTNKYGLSPTFKLGVWVNSTRTRYNRNNLTKGEIAELNSLGWIWDVKEHKLEIQIQQVEKFYREHKHSNISYDYVSKDGYHLGNLCSRLRQHYKKKTLSVNTIGRLEACDFVWDPGQAELDKAFGFIADYFEEHQHLNMSQSHVHNGYKLGAWLGRRRQDYRKGKLDPTVISKLENFNFEWDPLAAQKEFAFQELEEFYRNNGHSVVPSDHITDNGFKLGGWVVRIRKAATVADRRRLEKFDFVFNTLDAKWDKGITLLTEYKRENGHANPKLSETIYDEKTKTDFAIGSWLRRTLGKLKSAKQELKPWQLERKSILQEMGVAFHIDNTNWELGFLALTEYKNSNGNCYPSSKETFLDCQNQTLNLKNWAYRQITDFNNGQLSDERIKRLFKIGFKFEIEDDLRWDKALERLAAYREKSDTTFVATDYKCPDGFNLVAWFSVQRVNYQKGKLSHERASKIKALGFVLENRKFLEYTQLQEIVVQAGVKSQTEYLAFRKKSSYKNKMPSDPPKVYSKWTTWYAFLKKSEFETRNFLSFTEARKKVRALNLGSIAEYKRTDWKELDLKVPSGPHETYKEEWTNWSDYLGTVIIGQGFEYFTYKEAKAWVQKHKVKDWNHFWELKSTDKLPLAMPKKPDSKYKDNGWTSAADFFVSARKPPRKL